MMRYFCSSVYLKVYLSLARYILILINLASKKKKQKKKQKASRFLWQFVEISLMHLLSSTRIYMYDYLLRYLSDRKKIVLLPFPLYKNEVDVLS